LKEVECVIERLEEIEFTNRTEFELGMTFSENVDRWTNVLLESTATIESTVFNEKVDL